MAAYPSIGLQHNISPLNPRISDVSDAGTVRTVDLNEVTAYRISITHPLIDSTDRATLQTFYDTNRDSVNTITLAGDTYDVQFMQDYSVESVSSAFFDLSTVLVGNKQ